MPAITREIEEAEKEGVNLMLLATPIGFIISEGVLKGIRCVKMRLGEPDASGRRRPIPIPESEFEVGVDNAIIAVGQMVSPTGILKGLEVTQWDTIPQTGGHWSMIRFRI